MRFVFVLSLLCLLPSVSSYYFISWKELHTVSSVEDFHIAVPDIVHDFACEDCRSHFKNLVDTHPMPVDRVGTLEEVRIWMWLAHNMVNVRIGKEWAQLTVLDQYESTCS